MSGDNRYQSRSLEEAKAYTLEQIEKTKREGVNYLFILFHDRYFCDQFASWKAWYIRVVKYLKEEGVEFVSFEEAIKELKRESINSYTVLCS